MLSQTGMPAQSVFLATIIDLLSGPWWWHVICLMHKHLGWAWMPSLPLPLYLVWFLHMAGSFGMVFICGVISLIITLTKVRKMIIDHSDCSSFCYFSGDPGFSWPMLGLRMGGFWNSTLTLILTTVVGQGQITNATYLSQSICCSWIGWFNNQLSSWLLLVIPWLLFSLLSKRIKGGIYPFYLSNDCARILIHVVDIINWLCKSI